MSRSIFLQCNMLQRGCQIYSAQYNPYPPRHPLSYSTANAGALEALPASLEEAIARAGGSAFVEKVLSADTARKYLALKQAEQNRWFAARDKEKYQDEAYFGVL